MTPRPVICLSSQYWEGGWFRKHHFMARLAAAGHPVLYVEPSHSLVRRAGYDGRSSNPAARARTAAVAGGVTVLTPARLPPKPHLPRVSAFWRRRVVRDAQRWAQGQACADPLWWVYDPEYAPVLGAVAPERLVFDLVDDLAAYHAADGRRAQVRACIAALAARAGGLVCTSEPLRALLAADGGTARVVPNGYDAALFRPQGAPDEAEAAEAPAARRQRVGFIGTLFEFIDYDLIAGAARRLPEAEFVLVGHLQSHPSRAATLFGLPNVRHVEVVPRGEVPAWVAGFDVCVAPFRLDAVSRSVSPLKFYEYLAMHKPVVCTPMEGLEHEAIARFIDVADAPGRFAELVEQRLSAWPVDLGELDAELARCTWDARFAAVLEALPEGALGA